MVKSGIEPGNDLCPITCYVSTSKFLIQQNYLLMAYNVLTRAIMYSIQLHNRLLIVIINHLLWYLLDNKGSISSHSWPVLLVEAEVLLPGQKRIVPSCDCFLGHHPDILSCWVVCLIKFRWLTRYDTIEVFKYQLLFYPGFEGQLQSPFAKKGLLSKLCHLLLYLHLEGVSWWAGQWLRRDLGADL